MSSCICITSGTATGGTSDLRRERGLGTRSGTSKVAAYLPSEM